MAQLVMELAHLLRLTKLQGRTGHLSPSGTDLGILDTHSPQHKALQPLSPLPGRKCSLRFLFRCVRAATYFASLALSDTCSRVCSVCSGKNIERKFSQAANYENSTKKWVCGNKFCFTLSIIVGRCKRIRENGTSRRVITDTVLRALKYLSNAIFCPLQ